MKFEYNGVIYKSITACLQFNGDESVTEEVFRRRRREGWPLDKALTTPARDYTVKDHLGKSYSSMVTMAAAYGIKVQTLRSRLANGWSLRKALT